VIGNVRAGKMTPLLMMNNIKSPNFPDVPLLSDTGYKGAPSQGWYGLFAPAGTPKAIVDKTNAALKEVLGRPAVKEQLANAGAIVHVSSPDEFSKHIAAEVDKWKAVRDKAGIEQQ